MTIAALLKAGQNRVFHPGWMNQSYLLLNYQYPHAEEADPETIKEYQLGPWGLFFDLPDVENFVRTGEVVAKPVLIFGSDSGWQPYTGPIHDELERVAEIAASDAAP